MTLTAHLKPAAAPRPAPRAFSLIELLVVISIIGVLAALTVSVLGGVAKNKYIGTAQSELATLQSAIERYKNAYGVYPPSGTNYLVNPLLFELEGSTNNNGVFTTLDGQNTVNLTALGNVGLGGIVNSFRGAGDDAVSAKVFLPNLRINQIFTNYTYQGIVNFPIIVTSVGGPDPAYRPLGAAGLNPWRYNSANPTNNPGTYDLYIQLVINGKTNLICNWSKQIQINSSYP